MNPNSDRNEQLAAIRQFKSTVWQSPDTVRAYVHNTSASAHGIYGIIDEVMHQAFLEFCPPGSRVLDVGCGPGVTSIFLAGKGCSVVGTDISQAMLNVLEQNKGGLDIETRQGDAYNLPARGELFDSIVARQFLSHFPDWPVLIREMERHLKPGGHIVIHFFSRENCDLAEVLCTEECEFSTVPDPKALESNVSKFSANGSVGQISAAAAMAGLRLLKVTPVNFFYDNRLFGKSLGTEGYQTYLTQLAQHLSNPAVLQFVNWFESTVVKKFPVGLTYPCMFALHKPR